MTYNQRMNLMARSMRDLEIAMNEYVSSETGDCGGNCAECTRRVMLEVLRRRFDMAHDDLDALWAEVEKTCERERDK